MGEAVNELSLFTGIGGGIYGSKLLGWKTIGYVENDTYCQRVIRARINDGIFDTAPIFSDIREFVKSGFADQYNGFADVVTAGFPCQPFSLAGRQSGENDERNLWPDTLECISRIRPRFAYLENVPGLLISEYFGTILADLAAIGYDCKWEIISAAEIGGQHLRKRLWILAYPSGLRLKKGQKSIREYTHPYKPDIINVPQRIRPQPSVHRKNNGIPNRIDRIKALGNAQVPQVFATAWYRLNA
ncbi:MAG: DNA cytosine methyltransferase [Leptospiraceae bacterium]|nr:DNA cytosine methyltransferase [Leptospiraceae bacterium]